MELPSALGCVVYFYFSLKLSVPPEHSARAVQLVTLKHITPTPRANANPAPEDICMVAGAQQTGNSSDQLRDKFSMPKAEKEEVVFFSFSLSISL